MNYLKELKTIEKVEEIKSSIDTLNLKLSGHSGGDLKSVFEKSFGNNLFIFENLLRKEGIDFKEPQKVRSFLDDLKEQLTNARFVELVLAYKPDESSEGALLEWFHQNVGEDIILNIGYDPSIIAGVKITIDGMYLDYSSKKKFDEYFKKGAVNG